MTEETFGKARSKLHDLYQIDSITFSVMCDLFDSLADIEKAIKENSQ